MHSDSVVIIFSDQSSAGTADVHNDNQNILNVSALKSAERATKTIKQSNNAHADLIQPFASPQNENATQDFDSSSPLT